MENRPDADQTVKDHGLELAARSLDSAAWAAHLAIRSRYGADETISMVRAGLLPPEPEAVGVAAFDTPKRTELVRALTGSPLSATGQARRLLEALVATAPTPEDAAEVLAAATPGMLGPATRSACAQRWGDDSVVWEAFVTTASRQADALDLLWQAPLTRHLQRLSLSVWDQEVSRLIGLVRDGDATAEPTLLLALPGWTPSDNAPDNPGRLLVQSRLLQHRDTLPARVWLCAAVRVGDDLIRQVSTSDLPRREGTVRDQIEARSHWLRLGVKVYERAATEAVAARAVELWGDSIVTLAGPGDAPTTMLPPDPLAGLTRRLDRLFALAPADQADGALRELRAWDTPPGAVAETWAMAVGARTVQLLTLGEATPAQWETATFELLRITRTLAATPIGVLTDDARDRVWDHTDGRAAVAGLDLRCAPMPSDPATLHVSRLSRVATLGTDGATLLHQAIVERVTDPELAADAYRTALSMLDTFDGTVRALAEVVAAAMSAPGALTDE